MNATIVNPSAIIVPVPEAHSLEPLRGKYDPSATRGLPAHITVLYPFLDSPISDSVIELLGDIFATIDSFNYRLEQVARFPLTVYSRPQPAAPFVELIRSIHRRWPEHPPYGGLHDDIIPHLTVGDKIHDKRLLDSIASDCGALLPIDAYATEAWLMEKNSTGMWLTRRRFAFRRSTHKQ